VDGGKTKNSLILPAQKKKGANTGREKKVLCYLRTKKEKKGREPL